MRVRIVRTLAIVAVWTSVLGTPFPAGTPKIQFQETETLMLSVRPMNVMQPGGGPPTVESASIEGDSVGSLSFSLAWPDATVQSRLTLEYRELSASGPGHRVRLDSLLELPDGQIVRASRSIQAEHRSTALFEVHRNARRSLTLALELSVERTLTVASHPQPGARVELSLEVQHVQAGKAVTLETNTLNTFVGESVSYSFHLGGSRDGESMTVRLLPVRITGSLARIEVEIDGRIPGDESLLVSGRNELLVTTRGTTSTLAIEHGEPPTGYRILVTPRF